MTMAMAAGSISVEEFNADVAEFLEISSVNNDTWFSEILKSDPQTKFLVKKTSHCISFNTEDHMELLDDKAINNVNIEDDESTLETGLCSALSATGTTKVSMWEYHIVYSPSYGVPVLYFNANWQDGRLLTLEEVWTCVPVYYQQRLQHERWSFITQQEHPLLQRPFFQLHPCHTSTLMEQVLGENTRKGNYLLTWLSSVGPVVLLTVPLSYLSTPKQGHTKTTVGQATSSLPS